MLPDILNFFVVVCIFLSFVVFFWWVFVKAFYQIVGDDAPTRAPAARHSRPPTYEEVNMQCTPAADPDQPNNDVTNRRRRCRHNSNSDNLSSDDNVDAENVNGGDADDGNVGVVTLVGAAIMTSSVVGSAVGAVACTSTDSDCATVGPSSSNKEGGSKKQDDIYTPN
ncbi:uncharacterized protein [Choristoneura fumiferana]|uniref:uncharacterized protein n=1 Tax=Choristoneura fumiferana TaxID=7141 RepID=UPI003D154E0C